MQGGCISFVSYIKPQPPSCELFAAPRCISFVSYIKPQPLLSLGYRPSVVYRSFPTSNHNLGNLNLATVWLYIVRFLHQTTTSMVAGNLVHSCISFVSYIKPQPNHQSSSITCSCISFVSYIKPQLYMAYNGSIISCISFVSYIKPQLLMGLLHHPLVVYRSFPTSNHNL